VRRHNRRTFLKRAGSFGLSLASFSLLPTRVLAQDDLSPDSRPNILFVFADQHRPDWLGLNDALPVRTPNLDALAKRGVRFTNAICPSPICAPSRSSLASGKEYDRCGVKDNWDDYPVEQQTFYTLLRDSGYHVMGCGKFDLRKGSKSWGRDGKHNVGEKYIISEWGFSDAIDNSGKHDGHRAYKKGIVCPYYAYLEEQGLAETHANDFDKRLWPNYENTNPTPLPDEAYADNWVGQNGLDLIRSTPKGKPWFLQVNFNGPHEPMDVTECMKNRWKEIDFPLPSGNTEFPPEKHIEIRQNYAAMLENIDTWLGSYVEELKKLDELENTLIVYSADHGEMLGDRNMWEKSVPYQPAVGVPLIVGGPGVRENWECKAPATIMDLAATFLEFGGVPAPGDMDSRSMKPLLEGDVDQLRDYVYSGYGPWRMIFDGRYKLVRGFSPHMKKLPYYFVLMGKMPRLNFPTVLFDLQEDPFENTDIIEKAPGVAKRMGEALDGF
jgi:arylsulfatase A-like enzyme